MANNRRNGGLLVFCLAILVGAMVIQQHSSDNAPQPTQAETQPPPAEQPAPPENPEQHRPKLVVGIVPTKPSARPGPTPSPVSPPTDWQAGLTIRGNGVGCREISKWTEIVKHADDPSLTPEAFKRNLLYLIDQQVNAGECHRFTPGEKVEVVGSMAILLKLRPAGESQGYWTGSGTLTGDVEKQSP